jgi:hypothetical protein
LCKKRGGNLHIIETAADQGRGKTGEIADDPATERHHDVGTLDARSDERFTNPFEQREALRTLTRRHRHGGGGNPRRGKGALGRRQMVTHDRFVADNGGLASRPQRDEPLA